MGIVTIHILIGFGFLFGAYWIISGARTHNITLYHDRIVRSLRNKPKDIIPLAHLANVGQFRYKPAAFRKGGIGSVKWVNLHLTNGSTYR